MKAPHTPARGARRFLLSQGMKGLVKIIKQTTSRSLKQLVLSAVCLALAMVLPILTGQIPQIGSMLCPMHIPVLLLRHRRFSTPTRAPLLRSAWLGMPPLFPTAVCMAAEMAVYGAVAGLLYARFPRKKVYIYASLLIAMVAGRIVWGAVRFACTGLDASKFGFSAFWAGAVTTALPGIVLQIVLIPVLVMALEKAKLVEN